MTFYYFPMYITIVIFFLERDFFMFMKLPFIFEKCFDLSPALSILDPSLTTALASVVMGAAGIQAAAVGPRHVGL